MLSDVQLWGHGRDSDVPIHGDSERDGQSGATNGNADGRLSVMYEVVDACSAGLLLGIVYVRVDKYSNGAPERFGVRAWTMVSAYQIPAPG